MTFKEWYKSRGGMWDTNPYINMEQAWEFSRKQENEECAVLVDEIKVYCDGQCDEMGCRGHENDGAIAESIRAMSNS